MQTKTNQQRGRKVTWNGEAVLLVVMAEANGGGQAVCSQWMAMLDGGSALSLFCVSSSSRFCLLLLCLFVLFFSFLTRAQGGVAAVAMGRNRNGGVAAQWL
jgi:hypothetical protein